MSGRRDERPPRPGQVLTITSFANPRIKDIKALALPKHRKERGVFLGEGLKLVTDALAGHWPIEAVVYSTEAGEQPAVQKAAATARARGADILSVGSAVLANVTRRENPQTVLGVFAQRLAPAADIVPGKSGVWVALETVRDPGNLGTIIRTVDAVGADGVILIGDTVDPFSVETVRATMGSLFHVPLVRMSVAEFLALKGRWPGQIVGTHLSATADFRAGPYDRPTILLMGGERAGLTEPLAQACDRLVRIPMTGQADSLNLAVATGVMLYEIRRNALPASSESPVRP
ncbi:MAG: TrmH family RNA methyltransferase [Bauldia sp.]